MLKSLGSWWEETFLKERPSLSLGLFRIAVAATVGLHILPTLLQMKDNYLSTAFREYNLNFFTVGVVRWVDGNSDAVVWSVTAVFLASWLAYLLGFLTWASGWLMMAGCYYFYARNCLHIGTLSYDILLVTLFLVLLTPYPGDSFSLDSLLRGDPDPYRRKRPIFIQQLLKLQIAATFLFTGLCKWTAQGNWIHDNPYFYLMHSPPLGVIKAFPFRSFLGAHPTLCWTIGLGVIAFEMSLWLWLYWKRTRLFAIAAAIGFHVLLVATMHVPTIFFFLFPPQLLLFVEPEAIVAWLDSRRRRWARRGRDKVVFDGRCGFCRASLARLQALDPTGRLEPVDFRTADVRTFHRGLTDEVCRARLHLLEREGRLSGGFDAFRRMSLKLPLLWPLAPALYLPGMGFQGDLAYEWVSRNRYALSRLHGSRACRDNACLE